MAERLIKGEDVVIGQGGALGALKAALRSGRLSHCYIFAGPEGMGRRTTALCMAKALNCERNDEASELRFCGECSSCLGIDKGIYPDVSVFAAGARFGAEPEARARLVSGPITVAEARQLREEIASRPALGRKRVYIVDHADEMREEASNTLLKTLEEPPAHGLLILLAQNWRDLLPTILSRAQVIRFSPVASETILGWLENRFPEAERTILRMSVALSDGKPGLAYLLAQEEDLRKAAAKAVVALAQILEGDAFAPFIAVETLQNVAFQWYNNLKKRETLLSGRVENAENKESIEGSRIQEGLTKTQILRQYVPAILNLAVSFLRYTKLHKDGEWTNSDFERAGEVFRGLDSETVGKIVQEVAEVVRWLSANVNISLALQLFALEIASYGESA